MRKMSKTKNTRNGLFLIKSELILYFLIQSSFKSLILNLFYKMGSNRPVDLDKSTNILKVALADLIFSSQNNKFKYKLLAKLNVNEDSKSKLESKIGCLINEFVDNHFGVVELESQLSDDSNELDIKESIKNYEIDLSNNNESSTNLVSDIDIPDVQETKLNEKRALDDELDNMIQKECKFPFKKDDFDCLQ